MAGTEGTVAQLKPARDRRAYRDAPGDEGRALAPVTHVLSPLGPAACAHSPRAPYRERSSACVRGALDRIGSCCGAHARHSIAERGGAGR